MNLESLVRDCFVNAGEHRINIIGALPAKERDALLSQLLTLVLMDDETSRGRTVMFGRRIQDQRKTRPLGRLSEPEYVQLCNFLAGTFVGSIPGTEFNARVWHEVTGTLG